MTSFEALFSEFSFFPDSSRLQLVVREQFPTLVGYVLIDYVLTKFVWLPSKETIIVGLYIVEKILLDGLDLLHELVVPDY